MAPAFADFFTRTKRFADGRRYFDEAIARQPADSSQRLLRGRLARLAGDTAAAESEFRAILASDPADQNTTETLVNLLGEAGQAATAEKVTLDAANRQPRNQPNNFRAAIICEERHDETGAMRFLTAAERSGPVTSGFELHLARRYFNQRQLDEALIHLAEARRISRYEDDPATTRSIDEVIANIRAQMQ
jgi:tetratricopeptide (TPR) repeat protein